MVYRRWNDTRAYDRANPGPWLKWFAWYPILLFNNSRTAFLWLENVERRSRCDGICYYWEYRLPDGTQMEDYPMYE